jgi:hypothetical protein
MESFQSKYEVLKNILRGAYFEKEHAEIGEQWQINAMRRIRDLGPIISGPSLLVLFERFVWRLTPAACVLILLLTTLLFKLDFIPEYGVFSSLIYDKKGVTLAQLHGLKNRVLGKVAQKSNFSPILHLLYLFFPQRSLK